MTDLPVGSLIRNARKAAGYTLRDLAELLGLSHAHLCDVGHGRRALAIDRWSAICAVLPTLTMDALAAATVEDTARCDGNLTVRPGIASPAEHEALAALLVRMAKVASRSTGAEPDPPRAELVSATGSAP